LFSLNNYSGYFFSEL